MTTKTKKLSEELTKLYDAAQYEVESAKGILEDLLYEVEAAIDQCSEAETDLDALLEAALEEDQETDELCAELESRLSDLKVSLECHDALDEARGAIDEVIS